VRDDIGVASLVRDDIGVASLVCEA
jgi:hypothetical protein